MCGEKGQHPPYFSDAEGSPPRVRGKGGVRRGLLCGGGITPACAGKSYWIKCAYAPIRDHPRVCGEKVTCACSYMMSSGSPPRVRGKGNANTKGERWSGITPACAGKSVKVKGKGTMRGDHPRVCGEKLVLAVRTITQIGSPPRVRGKESSSAIRSSRRWITPACAGKSL